MTNEKTTSSHWDDEWSDAPRYRLPSSLNVSVRNFKKLLRRHVRPGSRFLEIGCAPGKMLAWVAAVFNVDAAGIDYSKEGIRHGKNLFEALNLKVDLRQEDIFHTTFEDNSFDLVYSAGLIEHFDDPAEIVTKHIQLAKPGGKILIVVPNLSGIFRALKARYDKEGLAIHNLEIMSCAKLRKLAPPALVEDVNCYAAGCFSPWIIGFHRGMPRPAALLISYLLNGLGLLQPIEIPSLQPMLILEMRKRAQP